MKGVVLAGGMGTRLLPMTEVTNKHLLPVYNKPMIFYPIETLAKAGIKDIMVVVGGNSIGDILDLLGSGSRFGVNLTYRVQDKAGGIAQALYLAKDFVGGENETVAVILGDNTTDADLTHPIRHFPNSAKQSLVFFKEVEDPQRFGCPVFKDGNLVGIEEKPTKPKSKYAVIGVYLYRPDVFTRIEDLKPSKRGELEITDINNSYLALNYDIIDDFWSDAGTPESLAKASDYWRAKHEASSGNR